mmetsp:Transcript_2897/g.11735  ORF Transcript_2897/g.11735 Transcript_2897/m.11735 type:complete len:487 (+) Transcript_2897:1509-2969(+)
MRRRTTVQSAGRWQRRQSRHPRRQPCGEAGSAPSCWRGCAARAEAGRERTPQRPGPPSKPSAQPPRSSDAATAPRPPPPLRPPRLPRTPPPTSPTGGTTVALPGDPRSFPECSAEATPPRPAIAAGCRAEPRRGPRTRRCSPEGGRTSGAATTPAPPASRPPRGRAGRVRPPAMRAPAPSCPRRRPPPPGSCSCGIGPRGRPPATGCSARAPLCPLARWWLRPGRRLWRHASRGREGRPRWERGALPQAPPSAWPRLAPPCGTRWTRCRFPRGCWSVATTGRSDAGTLQPPAARTSSLGRAPSAGPSRAAHASRLCSRRPTRRLLATATQAEMRRAAASPLPTRRFTSCVARPRRRGALGAPRTTRWRPLTARWALWPPPRWLQTLSAATTGLTSRRRQRQRQRQRQLRRRRQRTRQPSTSCHPLRRRSTTPTEGACWQRPGSTPRPACSSRRPRTAPFACGAERVRCFPACCAPSGAPLAGFRRR